MFSYIQQLEKQADGMGVRLIDAFKKANIPTSTYYRAKQGCDLRLATARKVSDAIKFHALQNAHDDNQ
jgi:predicted transcriptional regulator